MSSPQGLGLNALLTALLSHNKPLQHFYSQLYKKYNPDITGYTLIFMIPPEFSSPSYANNKKVALESFSGGFFSSIIDFLKDITGLEPEILNSLDEFAKYYPFFALDYTPPQTRVGNSQVQSRSGALTYASDVTESETINISFLESSPLGIYKFHLLWVEYIREILRGEIAPADKYLNRYNIGYFGAQDYLASLYIVKYLPDMDTITYVAKCTGVFPLSLPSKELIGSRTTNEITILPFEYSCISFREYVEGISNNDWILKELTDDVLPTYDSSLFDIITDKLKDIID